MVKCKSVLELLNLSLKIENKETLTKYEGVTAVNWWIPKSNTNASTIDFIKTFAQVVHEFCRISVEFLRKGINAKVYQTASQKLEVESSLVQKAVEGLMYALLEASKRSLSEIDFQDSLKAIGLSEELQQALLQHYIDNRAFIRSIQKELSMDLPHYTNLEWRLDVKVASRSLHHQLEPSVLLKLHTEDSAHNDVTVLAADPSNLLHLTRMLEDALHELNTVHCRRILRHL